MKTLSNLFWVNLANSMCVDVYVSVCSHLPPQDQPNRQLCLSSPVTPGSSCIHYPSPHTEMPNPSSSLIYSRPPGPVMPLELSCLSSLEVRRPELLFFNGTVTTFEGPDIAMVAAFSLYLLMLVELSLIWGLFAPLCLFQTTFLPLLFQKPLAPHQTTSCSILFKPACHSADSSNWLILCCSASSVV